MKLNEVLAKLDVTGIINDYLAIAGIFEDVGVATGYLAVLEYVINKQVLNRYKNFDCLYDEHYTLENLEVIITENIPEIVTILQKNSIVLSKVFNNIGGWADNNNVNSSNKSSYSGLNAEDTYHTNTQDANNSTFRPLAILANADVSFKKVLNVMKIDIEKLLKLYYVVV